jgi:hypothetical protein
MYVVFLMNVVTYRLNETAVRLKLMCQKECGQTARNDQFKDLIGAQYPFTIKQYKPAQVTCCLTAGAWTSNSTCIYNTSNINAFGICHNVPIKH